MDDAKSCFAAAAGLLSRRPGPTAITMREEIRDTLDYVAQNYDRAISLQSAASHVQLSKSWFGTLFKAEVHQPFSDYLIAFRIARAKELLKSSNVTVSRISEAVGIPDPHYFTRIFTEKTGCSPKEYRAETRKQNKASHREKEDSAE